MLRWLHTLGVSTNAHLIAVNVIADWLNLRESLCFRNCKSRLC